MANNRRYKQKKVVKPDNYNPPFGEEILAQSIDILKLREDTKELLVGANVTTIKDVVKKEDKDFYKISTFNKKNLFDVKNGLKVNKLFLKPTVEVTTVTANEQANNGNSNNSNLKNNESNGQQRNRRQGNNPTSNNKNNNKFNNNYVEMTKVVRPPKPVKEIEKEIPDIYVKVNKNGKWGFKDRKGEQVVAPLYDELYNYKDDLCCVQKGELFGYINRQGEEIIPMEYQCANSFSEGYACVFKGEKCGYINTQNEVVVDFNYDAGTPVINGQCRVKKEGKWGELHIAEPTEDIEIVGKVELGVKNIRWII
jgi:hypothetical protein